MDLFYQEQKNYDKKTNHNTPPPDHVRSDQIYLGFCLGFWSHQILNHRVKTLDLYARTLSETPQPIGFFFFNIFLQCEIYNFPVQLSLMIYR